MRNWTFAATPAVLACALSLAVPAATAQAQAFPQPGRPVRIVVPFSPGGATDIQARLIAQKMGEALGSPVVVDNKPGGSTVIGAREVQKSAPDGHTLLYTIAIHVQLPHLYRTPPWDVFRDFTPITAGAIGGTVLTAHQSVPAGNLRELIAYARANPGRLNYASFGTGTTAHLNGEWLRRLAGIEIVHVPYKGSGDAMKDLLSGQVQLFFDGVNTAIGNTKTGKVKMIAAATEKRIPVLPELPTMKEQGYDMGIDGFLGFFGPAQMAPATLEAVYRALARAITQPDVKAAFVRDGYEAAGMPPAEYAKFVRDISERWAGVIRDVGVKLDQ
jgi:tripartite-type tricarboxylate transporter receptor subunit TctC